MVIKASLPYYLPVIGGKIIGFLHFTTVLLLWKNLLKNDTLFDESYFLDIIECFVAEYLQALIARFWPKKL